MTKKQKNWIKSVVATAQATDVKLPYQRGQRAAVAERLRAKDKRRAA